MSESVCESLKVCTWECLCELVSLASVLHCVRVCVCLCIRMYLLLGVTKSVRGYVRVCECPLKCVSECLSRRVCA